jgi:tetratricopeptide (TPR) repeat protein
MMKIHKSGFCSLLALVITLVLLATISVGEQNSIKFEYNLITAQHAPYPPPYLTKEVRHYYDFKGARNVIYNNMDLVGYLRIENPKNERVKLTSLDRRIADYMTLGYSQSKFGPFSPLATEYSITLMDSISNKHAVSNDMEVIIPAGNTLEIALKCHWQELSKITEDTIILRLTFNNNITRPDSTLFLAQFESDPLLFYVIPMETKLDSIMHFEFKADQAFNHGRFEDAISICQTMIGMDSTLYNPHYLITLSFWRLENYDSAIEWANKTLEILKWQQNFGEYHSTSDHGQYYEIINELIQKFQRHEPWDPNVLIHY